MRFLVTYSFIINYYAKVTTIFHSIKLNCLFSTLLTFYRVHWRFISTALTSVTTTVTATATAVRLYCIAIITAEAPQRAKMVVSRLDGVSCKP